MFLDSGMMNKRGLSNIVATVLIVLLALAAVAIVWGFLRPTFDRASSSTNLRSACFLVELEVTQCTVNGGGTDTDVAYRLVSDDPKLSDVVVVVEDNSGLTATEDPALRPGAALESETANVDTSALSGHSPTTPFKARVAARVSDGTSSEVCPESVSVVCA
jgi:FlaG/FlaF family flagellin (archaellin)